MNKFLYIITLVLLLGSCNYKQKTPVRFTGETQGTYYVVTYFDKKNRNFQVEIDTLLRNFDLSASMWVTNSTISKINRNEKGVIPDSIFLHLFKLSKKIYEMSAGSFDPTIGPLVNAWGFGFTDRIKVNQQVVDSLLPLIGFDKVNLENRKITKVDPRIQFDFNAIAQGYSVDLIGEFLEKKGIDNYLVDIGGEVLAKGKKPNGDSWKVCIEKPKDKVAYGESLKAIVNLKDKALATSGNYRKFYEKDGIRYSHTINPMTGYPVQHALLSVSVLAENCATADAYATAFMVMGIEKAKEFLQTNNELEGYFIYSDEEGNMKTFFTNGFERILEEVF